MYPDKRKDKLVNPNRVGIFIGYIEEITKYFRVYSLEHRKIIKRNVIEMDETTKKETINFRLQGPTGP
jgi:hypothetical protein